MSGATESNIEVFDAYPEIGFFGCHSEGSQIATTPTDPTEIEGPSGDKHTTTTNVTSHPIFKLVRFGITKKQAEKWEETGIDIGDLMVVIYNDEDPVKAIEIAYARKVKGLGEKAVLKLIDAAKAWGSEMESNGYFDRQKGLGEFADSTVDTPNPTETGTPEANVDVDVDDLDI